MTEHVSHDASAVGPCSQARLRAFGRQAPDRNERDRADPRLPFADPREALRREGHRLQQRRIDRPQSEIVGSKRKRSFKLFFIVSGDAQLDAGGRERSEIRAVEILLAEMHEPASLLDCDAPIIIDDKRRSITRAEAQGRVNGVAHLALGSVFDAELHELHAQGQQALEPARIVDDQIEGVEPHASCSSKARPSTGVDASAKSRGVISPPRCARLPASMASAKACAISTGSAARATAVFSSAASKPSSMTAAAWEGAPSPASTMSGVSLKRARNARSPKRLLIPRPEPIGAAQSISTRQPASRSFSA